jgi:hypothetical protein
MTEDQKDAVMAAFQDAAMRVQEKGATDGQEVSRWLRAFAYEAVGH